jgi:hypothetical protein
MFTPGITRALYPSQTSLPTIVSPRLGALITRSMVVVAHGSPKIPNGNVDGPRSAWLPPDIRKRTFDAIAQ